MQLPKLGLRIDRLSGVGFAVAAVATLAGCDGPPSPPPMPPKPLAALTLTLACPDPAFAKHLANQTAGWAGRTGATLRIVASTPADFAVVRPATLGAFAAAGELDPLPDELQAEGNPLHWGYLLGVYSRALSQWGGKRVALPLAGEGFVLAYRADRLAEPSVPSRIRQQFVGQPLPRPTWNDLADLAAHFHESSGNKPTLAALPADPDRLLTLFHQIAASTDRRAVTTSEPSATAAVGGDPLSFHFDAQTGNPRLTAPGFAAATDWLRRTKLYRATGNGDAVAALADGTAVAAILSLADLARLPRDETGGVAKTFAVARLPGAAGYFDAAGKAHAAEGGANYVPYLGTQAQFGVVFAKTPEATRRAAWDLLAELAGSSGGFSTLANPTLGAGPFRSEQLEEARGQFWYGYGFDGAGTRGLIEAVNGYVARDVENRVMVLRTPNQAELMAALEKEVRRAATGDATGVEAMQAATAAWRTILARTPPDVFRGWVRAAAGLE